MDIQKAKQILSQSITNLQSRRGQLLLGDVEAEIINNACLYLLKNHNSTIKKVHDVSQLNLILSDNIFSHQNTAKLFGEAGRELFPNDYGLDRANSATLMILQNISWSGMWDFLRNYFQQNHGIQIDNVQATPISFHSNKHKRYENGLLKSESSEKRVLNIIFIKEKKEITISIEPSLSPKNAYLVSQTEKLMKYKGFDPDYLFHIHLDKFEEVEKFVLEMPNRNLKIEYFD